MKYQKRLSGPLLGRIDIHVEVPRVDYEKLAGQSQAERSDNVRARVEAARARQRQRFAESRLTSNADMGAGEVRDFCRVDTAGHTILRAEMQQLQLSARVTTRYSSSPARSPTKAARA